MGSVDYRGIANSPRFSISHGINGFARSGLLTAIRQHLCLVADGIAYLLPERSGEACDVALGIGFDTFSILCPLSDGRLQQCGPARPWANIEDAGKLLRELMAELGIANPRIAIAIDEDVAVQKVLTIPHAPSRLVEPLVANAVAPTVPFQTDDIRLAYAVTSQTALEQTLDISVVDRATIDPVMVSLEKAGLAARFVLKVKDGQPVWTAVPSWLGRQDASRVNPLMRWKTPMRTGILACGIVFASAASNIAYSTAMLAHLGADATSAIAESRRRAALEADVGRVRTAAAQAIANLAIMETLTDRLDDSVSLDRLSIGREEMEVSVTAPSAGTVLKVVGSIPGLNDATLKSAVSRDQALRMERFVLSARLTMPAQADRRP